MTKSSTKLLLPSMNGWQAVVGDHPKLVREKEGKLERIYFPHVIFPTHRHGGYDQITVNSGGWAMENHDAHALLIASAPSLLKELARAYIRCEACGELGEANRIADVIAEARGFVDRISAIFAIRAADGKGQLK